MVTHYFQQLGKGRQSSEFKTCLVYIERRERHTWPCLKNKNKTSPNRQTSAKQWTVPTLWYICYSLSIAASPNLCAWACPKIPLRKTPTPPHKLASPETLFSVKATNPVLAWVPETLGIPWATAGDSGELCFFPLFSKTQTMTLLLSS